MTNVLLMNVKIKRAGHERPVPPAMQVQHNRFFFLRKTSLSLIKSRDSRNNFRGLHYTLLPFQSGTKNKGALSRRIMNDRVIFHTVYTRYKLVSISFAS